MDVSFDKIHEEKREPKFDENYVEVARRKSSPLIRPILAAALKFRVIAKT